VLAQVLFHHATGDRQVIDVIALAPDPDFGPHAAGSPFSLALRVPLEVGEAAEVRATFARWATSMRIVALRRSELLGEECLAIADAEGDGMVLQIRS
jgi:hypothetical protein